MSDGTFQSVHPFGTIWVAIQELGAALDAAGDLPDWARDLDAALDAAREQAEAAALAEEPCPECGEAAHDGECRNALVEAWASMTEAEQDAAASAALAPEKECPWRLMADMPGKVRNEGEVVLLYKPDEPRSGPEVYAAYWGQWGDDPKWQWISVGGRPIGWVSMWTGSPVQHGIPTHWMPIPARRRRSPMPADRPEKTGLPFLAFTRKYGWLVVTPAPQEPEHTLGFSRPGGVRIQRVHVLATAPLPPVPDEAL